MAACTRCLEVLHRQEDLRPYECDGLSAYRTVPLLVVLPERTVFIASAPDEEVLGLGAPLIVSRLKDRGVRLQAVMDELREKYGDSVIRKGK